MHWIIYAGVAIVLWGINGLFMKLGTNRVSARSMVIWVTAGFVVLLPWMYLLIVGNSPAKISAIEASLLTVSVAINAIATYQFLWTNLIHP